LEKSFGINPSAKSPFDLVQLAKPHRDGKRFVVRADELLTAFLELESAIRACGEQGRLSTPCREGQVLSGTFFRH